MSPLEEGPATPGEHQGTVWAAEGLTLAPGVDAGEFVSAPRPTPPDQGWARLRWAPAVPYGHALANAGAPLVDFPEGQVSQAGLRLLLHLDDPDVWDAGPLDLPVQVVGGHEVAGLFRDAWHLPGTDRITVPAEAVRFGAQDFTWATFAKITPCAGRNGVLLGGEGVARLPAHAWLGCQADDPCPGPGLGGTFRPRLGSSADECAGALPDDDRWHHLAVIKQANRLRFFMDGALAHEASPDLSGDFNLDGFFQIGAFDGGYPLTASVEELAIWARALSPGEIAALSARGLGRAELWARGCPSTDDCGDQPFARLAEQPGGPGFWMDALPRLYPAVQFKVVLRRESGPPPVVRRIILEAD
ncbi:MAG: LamG domain-containing protein [Myxococcales bacterium]|nr:LamG domain-containing protein [Myxococcales bacterium]